ncbi:MAG: hypothetical protein ABWZ01_01830 [Methyloceanibacter sp.]
MNLLMTLAAATPTPYPAYKGNPDLITPGVWGFIAIFLVAAATVFLLIDMNRRIRRTRYREEIREKLAAEQAAEQAEAAAKGRKKS